ncbi:MAG TPA: filamentous hemagglutinin N-terminal domain-containing protein, partial [Burkholderiales bacterium]|nr:filamentous hemagglutinin N-terminal domain-containing protein [Burkholderiales bacterium]
MKKQQSFRKKCGNPRPRANEFVLRPIVCGVMLAWCHAASANPTGAQVVNGAASFARPDARTLNITNTPGAIINWQGFSIASGEVTRFTQQNALSTVLNRVVGADISKIQGQLLSNGRVFLINPAGILIGAGAVIDTAGFVGSSLNMLDRDFLAGRLSFDGGGGPVVNRGTISAAGDIFLVGANVRNSGLIRSESGDVVLAAGKSVTITSPAVEGVQFTLQAPGDTALNLGTIEAGNAVGMFAGTLRHSGDIRAGGMSVDASGRVVLAAQKDATVASGATISARGAHGGAVTIQSGDTTLVSGSIDASETSGAGGTVHILGNRVGLLDGARVSATGETGGGTILVGGDYQGRNPGVQNAWRTFVGRDVLLSADAVGQGNGGKVILWADDSTHFAGSISARGGERSGDGGFAEVSGKGTLDFRGRADTRAPNGRAGTLLLDPTD